MADKKITQLTNITGANLVDADEFVVVDISADETKAITLGELKEAFDSGSGFVRITGDTMTGNLDVQGTVTADGLDISTLSGDATVYLQNAASARGMKITKNYDDFSANVFYSLHPTAEAGSLAFKGSQDSTQLFINSNGDISFYEGTGTTPKFFWDASAESLGIGTSSPRTALDVAGRTTTDNATVGSGTASTYVDLTVNGASTSNYGPMIELQSAGTAFGKITNYGRVQGGTSTDMFVTTATTNNLILGTNNAERMRIGSTGNVGIGVSPSTKFHVKAGTNQNFNVFGPNVFSNGVTLGSTTDGFGAYVEMEQRATQFAWHNGTTERMRIDSSGNLLVGMASPSNLTTGFAARANSLSSFCRDTATADAAVLALNKKTGDGDIVIIQKDGSTVGSIGVASSNNLYIGATAANHAGVYFGTNIVYPMTAGSISDASVNLGEPTAGRFKDLYLSGGVYLGGTGSANKLDDYEYGFFEPEFGGDVSDPTVTYDGTVGNEGRYVKVGRLVFIQINMRTDSVSGGSGAVVIRNLPFVTPDLSGQGGMSSFTIGYADNWGGERPIAGTISEGVTYINLSHRSAVDGNNITTNITDLGAGTNANLIRLSGTYYTTE